MTIAAVLVLLAFLLYPSKPRRISSGRGVMVSRSYGNPFVPEGRVLCGNCRGTGEDGFGIMPDSFPCGACGGRGSIAINPNAKRYTWTEFNALLEKRKQK